MQWHRDDTCAVYSLGWFVYTAHTASCIEQAKQLQRDSHVSLLHRRLSIVSQRLEEEKQRCWTSHLVVALFAGGVVLQRHGTTHTADSECRRTYLRHDRENVRKHCVA